MNFCVCFLKIGNNGLGIALDGEIEGGTLDLAISLNKTNLYEVNSNEKNEYNSFLAMIEVQTLNIAL